MPKFWATTGSRSLYVSTAALVALVCVALIAIDGLRTWQAYKHVLADSATDTGNLARALAVHVGETIEAIDTDLAGMQQQLESAGTGPEEVSRLHAQMEALLAGTQTIHGFNLYDAGGVTLTKTGPAAGVGIEYADRTFFQYCRTHDFDQGHFDGPFRSRIDNVWVIVVARRINHPDGTFAGVIVGSIDLDLFSKFYATFDIGANGVLLLARTDGTILVRRPYEDRFVGQQWRDLSLLHDVVAASPAGSFDSISRTDGIARLGSFRNVTGFPLVVLAALDRGDVLADWWSETRAHAAGLVFALILIGVLALHLTAKISDQSRKIDERLRQSEKMEAIGNLAAGVAHDFNNILQVILGGMEILEDEGSVSPKGRALIADVEAAASRGSALTHHLLAYSRKQYLKPQLVDLCQSLEELRGLLTRMLRANIAVTVAVAPGTGGVRVDAAQLETALINLATNAAQAMPDGGALRCQAYATEDAAIGDLAPGRYVVIAVTDTGTGMTANLVRQACEPFFTTRGPEGSGLGLAMVQGFSRQSGGDVRVMSVVGQGTRVEIWLPQVAVPAPVPAAVAPVQRTTGAGHVLLVDDSPDVLTTVDALLRSAGFTVRQAANAYEALAAVASGERFDVLVSDYMMPGLDGLALVKEARGFLPALPALIVSGFVKEVDLRIDLPAIAVLHKPFSREQLVAAVSELVAA